MTEAFVFWERQNMLHVRLVSMTTMSPLPLSASLSVCLSIWHWDIGAREDGERRVFQVEALWSFAVHEIHLESVTAKTVLQLFYPPINRSRWGLLLKCEKNEQNTKLPWPWYTKPNPNILGFRWWFNFRFAWRHPLITHYLKKTKNNYKYVFTFRHNWLYLEFLCPCTGWYPCQSPLRSCTNTAPDAVSLKAGRAYCVTALNCD